MSLFLLWFGVMFPLVFSPGPANIVFAASGAKVGVKRSMPLVAGVDCIFIIKSLFIGFGLGQVVQNHPMLMNGLQIIGALYLIYLAIIFIKSSASTAENDHKNMGFIDGMLIQLLNSKGWLMVFLMFTLFTEQAKVSFGDNGILVLVLWLAVLNISMHIAWVKAGALLANLSISEHYAKALNIFYASCLLAVSIWLLIDNKMWSNIASIF
jgi:threonine/homoserine/homoserine lactone efflux protein